MEFCINEVDEEGVREENGRQVIRVARVEVWAVGEDIGTSKEVAWDMDDF